MSARGSTCEAAEIDDRRVQCVKAAADEFEVVRELFDDGTLGYPGVARQVFGRMADIGDCTTDAWRRRASIDRDVARRVARASLLWSAGDNTRAAAEAGAVWDDTGASEDCSSRAAAAGVAGIAEQRLGNATLALEWFERSLLEATRCEDDVMAAEAAARALAVAASPLRRPDASTRYLRRAEAALERAGSPPRVHATLLAAEAAVFYAKGDVPRALELAQQAADVLEREVGPDAYEMVALLTNVGRVARLAGQLDRAEDAYARAERISLASRGADAPALPGLRIERAMLADARGHTRRAIDLLRAEVERGGPTLPMSLLVNLAEFELNSREYESARNHYQAAIDALGDPPEDPAIAMHVEARLGLIAAELGDFAGAERSFARVRAAEAQVFAPDAEGIAWTRVMLALVRRRQGRAADALQMLEEVEGVIRAASDPELRSTHRLELAETMLELGRPESALAAAREGVDLRAVGTTEHASALVVLAASERASARNDDADAHLRIARETFERFGDPRADEIVVPEVTRNGP